MIMVEYKICKHINAERNCVDNSKSYCNKCFTDEHSESRRSYHLSKDIKTNDFIKDHTGLVQDIIMVSEANSYSQLLITNNGPCWCDITTNVCDIDCCCDSTCTSLQIQTFSCPYDQMSPISYGCFPSELLFQNNTAFLNVTIGNQYCVYQDNYTLRNFYYAPTSLGSSDIGAIADKNDMPKINTFFDAFSIFDSYSACTFGDAIYSLVVSNFVGILKISRPDMTGVCADGLPIGYLTNEIVSCNRLITNMPTDCANLPGISSYYITGMLVPAYPAIMTSRFIGTPIVGQYFAGVTCIGCTGAAVPIYNATNGFCSNVVTKVVYEIRGETNISAVIISLTTGNVNGTYAQTFDVFFNKSGLTTSGLKYSGQPGYVQGMPVKTVASNGTSLDLTMITGGMCGSGSKSSILFEVNSFSDCSVDITNIGNSAQVINNYVITSLNAYLPLSISAYGNLSTDNQVPRTTNDDSNPTNTLTVTKLTVYIIYARTGTLTLPQNRIIGYQTSYSYGSPVVTAPLYWVSVVVKFVDNSVTLFDLDGQVVKSKAGNTVRDFLYLLYVENAAPTLIGWSVTSLLTIVVVIINNNR